MNDNVTADLRLDASIAAGPAAARTAVGRWLRLAHTPARGHLQTISRRADLRRTATRSLIAIAALAISASVAQNTALGATDATSASSREPARGTGHAHVHGQARLDITLDGTRLVIEAELPMDTLTGFERAPRNDDERERLRSALGALRSPGLFRPTGDADCKPVAQTFAWPGAGETALPADDAHSDLLLTHTFECARPARLSSIDVGLFDAFSRLRRIEARIVGPSGAQARTLQRSRRVIEFGR